MTIHPVAARVAEMLMHPTEPMLPAAALDYVREETGLGASGAYEQIRHALAVNLELSRKDGLNGSGLHQAIMEGQLEYAIQSAGAVLANPNGYDFEDWGVDWYKRGIAIAELCQKLESCVIPEPVQQGEGK